MPAPTNTLLIEGSFSELSEELAQYIDVVNKAEADKGLHAEITLAAEKLRTDEQAEEGPDAARDREITSQRDEILKKLVGASSVLNAAPEKGNPSLTIACAN